MITFSDLYNNYTPAELLELEQQAIYRQDTELLRKIAKVKMFPKKVTRQHITYKELQNGYFPMG